MNMTKNDEEFRDFIMRGNVLELAVAVIVAGAFGAIVTSKSVVALPQNGVRYEECATSRQRVFCGIYAKWEIANIGPALPSF